MAFELSEENRIAWPIPTHLGVLANPEPVGWKASNDAEALAVWLAEHGSGSEHTQSAYRREIERFLLWLADQRMTVSDAMREDYHNYAKFLQAPGREWIASKRYRRTDPRWRPFIGPLSATAARQSLQILHSAIAYLQETGWLKANPMPSPKRLVVTPETDRQQMVENRQIPEYLFEDLEFFVANTLPLKDTHRDRYKRARLEVIVALAGLLGGRSADMTAGFLSDFSVRNVQGRSNWVWHIPDGKGRKAATLPVPDKVMRKISHLRLTLGMTRDAMPGETPCPIIVNAGGIPLDRYPDIDRLKGLDRSSLYRIVRALFSQFSKWLRAEGRGTDAMLMDRASTHYLRHTAIKRVTRTSKDLLLAQRFARHSNINTTAIYGKSTLEELGDWYTEQGW